MFATDMPVMMPTNAQKRMNVFFLTYLVVVSHPNWLVDFWTLFSPISL